MEVDIELIKSANLPPQAFETDYSTGQVHFVVRNPTYANVMWMHLWYHWLSKAYKNQNMMVNISDFDLSLPVVFDENYVLLSAQPSTQTIYYFGTFDRSYKPKFLLNVSILQVLIVYTILSVIIVIVTLIYGKSWRLMNIH